MFNLMFACVVAPPDGAESPEALQAGIAAALDDRELWRVIDFVQPEDRDVFLVQLDEQASFAAISGGAKAFAELKSIDERFGVAEHDWPRLDPVAQTAMIGQVCAGVQDPRGLARALGELQAKYGTKPVTIAAPTLNGDRSALVFSAEESPIVQIDGRYYLEEPDPAEPAARLPPAPAAAADPFADR